MCDSRLRYDLPRDAIMMNRIHPFLSLCLILVGLTSSLEAQPQSTPEAKITVDVNKPGHPISPMLFGVFFEDINLASDGGIYPELVRNRSFEDADTLQNWKFASVNAGSTASIITADVQARPPVPPLNPFNRKSLCIRAKGSFNVENDGTGAWIS